MADPIPAPVSAPDQDNKPHCQECGHWIGGGKFCYEHAPYMVYPKADGSFLSERYGRRHIWFDEPPTPADSALPASVAAPQEPLFDYVTALNVAQSFVRGSLLYRRFIDGTPLENDIAVWMTDFAHGEVMRDRRERMNRLAPPAVDAVPPVPDRLKVLARFGALIAHENLFDAAVNIDEDPTEGHENNGGRSWGFDTCPHPDCVMVRAASVPPRTET